MTISNPEDIRTRNNIPEDARLVSYYVGDGSGANDNAVNSFSSDLNTQAQPMKTPQNMEMNTSALLDTGS